MCGPSHAYRYPTPRSFLGSYTHHLQISSVVNKLRLSPTLRSFLPTSLLGTRTTTWSMSLCEHLDAHHDAGHQLGNAWLYQRMSRRCFHQVQMSPLLCWSAGTIDDGGSVAPLLAQKPSSCLSLVRGRSPVRERWSRPLVVAQI